MKKHGSGVVLALGLVLAGDAHAQDWGAFAAAFPAFPCQDGWMGCLVDGERVDPEVREDASGRAMPADLRVSWFDLKPTATFSPFAALSAYGSAPAVAATDEPVDDGDAVAEASLPSAEDTDPAAGEVDEAEAVTGREADEVTPEAPQPASPLPGSERTSPEPQEAEAARLAQQRAAVDEAAREPAGGDAVADAGAATPGTRADDGTCADLTSLEPTALLGKLSAGQVSCLESALAAAAKMTDKKKISLVLQANAWSKGDKAAWEKLVKRHLDEIDQSDPDLCYKYALQLSKQGAGRASGVLRWASVALENRTVWSGDTYTSRVYSLYKVRAAASQALWQAAEGEHVKAPSDESREKVEKYRDMTKVNAREWLEYARSSGKDASTALQLCISAAGTADYCEAG